MGISDHRKQRLVLRHTVNGPVGVKYFMPAVFAVCLCKHHQFHIRGVALGLREGFKQINDFVVRQGQTQFKVGAMQCLFATGADINKSQRLRLQFFK